MDGLCWWTINQAGLAGWQLNLSPLNWFLKNLNNPKWDLACRILSTPDCPVKIVSVSVGNLKTGFLGVGFGIDQELKKAMAYAFFEATERFILQQAGIKSSNGVAFHTVARQAQIRARNELIERHLFLAHFWGCKQFFTPSFSLGSVPAYKEVTIYLKKHGFKLDVFEMQKIKGLTSCVAVIQSLASRQRNGILLGAATRPQSHLAAQGAIFEALAQLNALQNGAAFGSDLSLRQFQRLQAPTPFDHARLGWNREYVRLLGPLFLKPRPARMNLPRKLKMAGFTFDKISSQAGPELQYQVYRACHPLMLEPCFQSLNSVITAKIIKKLNGFWGPDEVVDSIRELPHPFP